ncbi:MAG TPA: lipopolysaccharide assembly protein LapA domain-containing protein [bacterium]|nr:lipopolysaccharide assembly protein LapA domain-containing protein [bacterium]HPM99255.1 lipopolysaccharide assembly protein LapA domain-containing protein [bacterium]
MWVIKWLLIAAVVILIIGFAMQNTTQRVAVQFYQYRSIELPLWVVMYASFVAGLLFWLVVSIGRIVSLKRQLHKQHKESKNLRLELDSLRNASIDDSVIPKPNHADSATKPRQTAGE